MKGSRAILININGADYGNLRLVLKVNLRLVFDQYGDNPQITFRARGMEWRVPNLEESVKQKKNSCRDILLKINICSSLNQE